MFRHALLLGLFACGESPKHSAAGPTSSSDAKDKVATVEGEASTSAAPSTPSAPVAPAPSKPAEIPAIVAEIGGAPITWDELWGKAAPQLIEAEIALNQARTDALQNILMERLVEAEAKKAGMPPEAWVQAQISQIVVPPSDAEVTAFYEQNRARMQGSIEEMKPRISEYLSQERAGKAFRSLIGRLETDNGVKKFLPRYRLDVAAEDSARRGSAEAPIQIVEFSDFQCPYCSDAAKVVKEVEAKYGDKISVVYRHFPLPMHAQAHRAAEASQCANDQGGFWKFHDALFADQKPWTDEDFEKYAKEADLNTKDFKKCLSESVHAADVDHDMEAGSRVGMNGTPGFYVNGIVMSGARPLEDFVEVIDSELARLGR